MPSEPEAKSEDLITDEIRSWIGREVRPWTIEVSRRDVTRFAVATDDLNPLYLDEEQAKHSRYGGLIAPPLFYMAPLTEPVPETELRPDGLPFEGKLPVPPTPLPRLMDGGTEVEFLQPVRVGDVLTGRSKITNIYQKTGRSGPLIFVQRETTFTNQKGELVLIEKGASILR
jgi:hydroxyacyl-ACP dehydratase HTD2-like protein with hotdog domain